MTLNSDRPTETLNREELIQMAIRTARSGNKQSAKVMFQRVLNEDPRNERALLWMGALATDPKEKRRFLLKTLKVTPKPKNKNDREELQRMSHSEKASANRTLIYGGLIIIGALIVIAILVVVVILLSGAG